jgi:hypothetical protein
MAQTLINLIPLIPIALAVVAYAVRDVADWRRHGLPWANRRST